jgi:hypothetical protein
MEVKSCPLDVIKWYLKMKASSALQEVAQDSFL